MMMGMLAAGGLGLLSDGVRKADEDNPEGYYEYEPVAKLRKDSSWVWKARGKGIKVISRLLPDLPADYLYRVIFMRRDMKEILASQRVMLARRGEKVDSIEDGQLEALFVRHLEEIERWLQERENFQVLYVRYDQVLADPHRIARKVEAFLERPLATECMAAVVDRRLYRQRRS